jgi:hypothetical protein
MNAYSFRTTALKTSEGSAAVPALLRHSLPSSVSGAEFCRIIERVAHVGCVHSAPTKDKNHCNIITVVAKSGLYVYWKNTNVISKVVMVLI